MSESELVRAHFQKSASAFDSLYSGNRNRLLRILDRAFRKDLYDRFELTFHECQPMEGCAVLDVGCGSGRYAAECARRGAIRVVGIDLAQSMIDLAGSLATHAGVQGRCTFVCDDFVRMDFNERFDYSFALGILDYVADPRPLLRKMAQVTSAKMFLSFPKDTFPRATQRKVRYRLKGCPLYQYKKHRVEEILTSAGMTSWKIVELQGDYFVAISVAEGAGKK